MLALSTAVHDNIGINLQSSIVNDLKLKTRNGTHFNNRGYSLQFLNFKDTMKAYFC